jgi:hypothetical protein
MFLIVSGPLLDSVTPDSGHYDSDLIPHTGYIGNYVILAHIIQNLAP